MLRCTSTAAIPGWRQPRGQVAPRASAPELDFVAGRAFLQDSPHAIRVQAAEQVIEFADFQRVDMRIGQVTEVEDFPQARVPAWKLTIDFGPELGTRRSSAQITSYAREQLLGRRVVAVVNLPPRRIGPFRSEVLVLGALDPQLGVVLLAPDDAAALGSRIG